jgi:uncharacterized protein YjbI with pentapeptide repeats
MGIKTDREQLEQLLIDRKRWREGTFPEAEMDVVNISLCNRDFSGEDLRCFDFGEGTFAGSRFVNADLRYANLKSVILDNCDFSCANLSSANMTCSRINDANFADADLSFANLYRASAVRTNFSGANLSHAILHEADLMDADMVGANIDFSDLPLWCGSLTANFGQRQIVQMLYHLLSVTRKSYALSGNLKRMLLTKENVELANTFHRITEESDYNALPLMEEYV